MCLGVTCHLYFWQNDQGLLCATTVTNGRFVVCLSPWSVYWLVVRMVKLVAEQDSMFMFGLSGWSFYWWVVRVFSLLVDKQDDQ